MTKRCCFKWHCTPYSSTNAQRQGKKVFLPLLWSVCLSLSLSLPLAQKLNTTHTPSWPTPMMEKPWESCTVGDCTEATPTTLSMCHDWTGVVALSPPYKYQGARETNERGERDDILEDFERRKKWDNGKKTKRKGGFKS